MGQSLIHSAKIRKDLTLIETLDTSVMTFKLKYNCLPGDCSETTTFFPNLQWGTNGVPAADYSGWWGGNGNGNGVIFQTGRLLGGEPGSVFYALNAAFGVAFSTWQGVPSSADASYPDFQFPALSTITGNVILRAPFDNSDNASPFTNQHYYYMGSHSGAWCCDQLNVDMGYLPADAYAMDLKRDDGSPNTGNMQATSNSFGAQCRDLSLATPAASNACVSNATGNPYLVTEGDPYCILRVKAEF